jgi:hypothetical protein
MHFKHPVRDEVAYDAQRGKGTGTEIMNAVRRCSYEVFGLKDQTNKQAAKPDCCCSTSYRFDVGHLNPRGNGHVLGGMSINLLWAGIRTRYDAIKHQSNSPSRGIHGQITPPQQRL